MESEHAKGMTLIGSLLVVAASFVLAACSSSHKANLYKGQVLGRPVIDLVQCAGAPGYEFTRGSTTVLTYSASGYVLGGNGIPQSLCDASVRVEHDVVADVTYRTRYGEYVCEPIFKPCAVAMR